MRTFQTSGARIYNGCTRKHALLLLAFTSALAATDLQHRKKICKLFAHVHTRMGRSLVKGQRGEAKRDETAYNTHIACPGAPRLHGKGQLQGNVFVLLY